MPISTPAAEELFTSLSALLRTARSFAHLKHEQLGPSGVTLAVLAIIGERPARSGEVACQLGVTASSVSRAVATLERLGHLTRRPDPQDARAHLLEVTDTGRDVLHSQHETYAASLGSLLSTWDDTTAAVVSARLTELDGALAANVARMRRHGPLLSSETRNLFEKESA